MVGYIVADTKGKFAGHAHKGSGMNKGELCGGGGGGVGQRLAVGCAWIPLMPSQFQLRLSINKPHVSFLFVCETKDAADFPATNK